MDNNLNQSTINHYKERIKTMQALYYQFEQNKAILAQHQSLWQQTAELVKTLQDFYDNEFLLIYDAIEQGMPIELGAFDDQAVNGQGVNGQSVNDQCNNKPKQNPPDDIQVHSIMAQDTLWNGLDDYRQLLWWQIKFAINELEPD